MRTNVFFWACQNGFDGIDYTHNSIVDEEPLVVVENIMKARPDLHIMILPGKDDIKVVAVDTMRFGQR